MTSSIGWDPATYERFGDHRSRPFDELLGRVGAADPRVVVDLGCGNGPATMALVRRWPDAQIIGVDSSEQMLARAREIDPDGRVEWVHADVADVHPPDHTDVLTTNATLQWVPGHDDLIRRWVGELAPGGWFAMQVPGNFGAPSHRILRELAAQSPHADQLRPLLPGTDAVHEPAGYAMLLADAGCAVDVWETTYQQVLDPAGEQESPALEWTRGTALRPVLSAITDEGERAVFLAAYAERLADAYPRQGFGTSYPFRRIFAVGRTAVGERPAQLAGTATAAPQRTARADRAGTSRPGVVALDHVQVSCAAGSEDALRGFYAGVLGMHEVAKPVALAAGGGVWFEAGTARLHCGVEDGFRPAHKAHPALSVADVVVAAHAVRASGAAVVWDERLPGVRRFHTVDPVGNRLEIQQI